MKQNNTAASTKLPLIIDSTNSSVFLPPELMMIILKLYLLATSFAGWSNLVLLNKGMRQFLLIGYSARAATKDKEATSATPPYDYVLLRTTLPVIYGNAPFALKALLRKLPDVRSDRNAAIIRVLECTASAICFDDSEQLEHLKKVWLNPWDLPSTSLSPNILLLKIAHQTGVIFNHGCLRRPTSEQGRSESGLLLEYMKSIRVEHAEEYSRYGFMVLHRFSRL